MAGIINMKGHVRFYLAEDAIDTQTTLTAADKVSNAKGFSGFDSTSQNIDVTDTDSLVQEFEQGFTDEGTISLDLYLTAENFASLKAKQKDGKNRLFGMAVSNKAGDTILSVSATGFVQDVALTGTDAVGSVLGVTAVVKINSEIDFDWTEPTGE